MQGRKIAEHAMGLHSGPHRHLDYDKAASAIFTDPEIADVGLAEADAFASGRKVRVTKVPFSASAKALINDDPRGFVKIVSDPATGVVLGGSIVGRHAAELISVIALAVTANLKVTGAFEDPNRLVEYRGLTYDAMGNPMTTVTTAIRTTSSAIATMARVCRSRDYQHKWRYD